jgi:hypothetical protein
VHIHPQSYKILGKYLISIHIVTYYYGGGPPKRPSRREILIQVHCIIILVVSKLKFFIINSHGIPRNLIVRLFPSNLGHTKAIGPARTLGRFWIIFFFRRRSEIRERSSIGLREKYDL